MIPYHISTKAEGELETLRRALESGVLSGSGAYVEKCSRWLSERFPCARAFLTCSCSAALNMAAFLCGIEAGDEVILPSFTFTSTANAFAARGAHLKFIDIRPDTLNIDERQIEAAITKRTKAICVVHYAGVACEMDTIMDIARTYGLPVVEDAAQAMLAAYKGKWLGTLGDYGCFSFHDTKNFTMGEGGALLVRSRQAVQGAEIYYEKGTDRISFVRGEVDRYTWQGLGDSCVPCELAAAYLYPQLLSAEELNHTRLLSWNYYYQGLKGLEEAGKIRLPTIPEGCVHNAHIFYILCGSETERRQLTEWLRQREIIAVSHYVPLHSAPAGRRFGEFAGEDKYTSVLSQRLLRLPLYTGIRPDTQDQVLDAVTSFYSGRGAPEGSDGIGIVG